MAHFKKGDLVPFHNAQNTVLRMDDHIGSGAQADVYRARDILGCTYVAAKHCYGTYASDKARFHAKVMALARNPAPHPDLCWPISVSPLTSNKSFVYTMPLLEGYRSLTGVITGRDPLTDIQKAAILDKAAEILQALHRGGFVYGDISDRNIMYRLEPDGSIRVKFIDCENVTLPGFSLGLQGSGKFRAPELLLPDPDREDGLPQPPSIHSDNFAFAVLAFRIFFRRHPLDGELARNVRADDFDGFLEHYARNPRFIFDGKSNQPGPRIARKWDVFPRPMQIFFCNSFSQSSLHRNHLRPGMKEFRHCLALAFPV